MRRRFLHIFFVMVLAGSAAMATPSTQPLTRPSQADRVKAAELSHRASDLIDQKKLREAEVDLRQSLALEPVEPTRRYNLASVLASERKIDDALAELKLATDDGFTDFTHLAHNRSFDGVRRDARYQALLDRRPQIEQHAADLAIADLKDRLGEEYLYEQDVPHKLVYAVRLRSDELEQLKVDLVRQQEIEEKELFASAPDEFIRIIVPTAADFHRMVPTPHAGGMYDDVTRSVIAPKTGPVMIHEFTHALHAADEHAAGQEHPVWLSEGLAGFYESGEIQEGEAIVRSNPHLAAVRLAEKRNALIPLDSLLKSTREQFNARPNLTYGESALLLQFLDERRMLRKFYEAYKSGYATESTGRAALESSTGLKLTELEKEWRDWLRQQRPAPAPTSATRPTTRPQ